ncbi:MAG: methyltransferase domain-containing protein [bacterium]
MRILDVGCGQDKLPGAIGIDRSANTAADVVHDLDRRPWPFADAEFDHVRCQDVIEHLDDIVGVMEELHRVARPGATIHIRVPHFSSVQAYTDPTHRHFFSTESMGYFTEDSRYPHYTDALFAVRRVRLRLWKPYRWLGLDWLANRFPARYEKMFAFLFPAECLEFDLEVRPPIQPSASAAEAVR